jgi:hypothetical protein
MSKYPDVFKQKKKTKETSIKLLTELAYAILDELDKMGKRADKK